MNKKSTSGLTKKRKTLSDPNIDSMFLSSGLPGVPTVSGKDAEEVALNETSAMIEMIKENRRNYAERFRDIESGEFWTCVCFQSRSQKEEFILALLEKYAPGVSVEQFGDKYISGLELAEMLHIPITIIPLEVKKNRLAPKKIRKLEVID